MLPLNRNFQEVKLTNTRAERDLQDSLAEIFSILVTLDELEKAFLKDAIPEADYTDICDRSLKQYKSILSDETVMNAFVGIEEFKAEWEVSVALQTDWKRYISRGLISSSSSSKSPAPQSASASACPAPRFTQMEGSFSRRPATHRPELEAPAAL